MDSALVIHRLHFAFTITYHYLFPQLTMGLAPLIVIFKSLALWKGEERYNKAARFWAKIFAVNFLFGVITGIPMEFQFGTNWARFAQYSGGVIATSLAMEGVFAFFLESSFLGIFLFGEKRFGQKMHWLAAFIRRRARRQPHWARKIWKCCLHRDGYRGGTAGAGRCATHGARGVCAA